MRAMWRVLRCLDEVAEIIVLFAVRRWKTTLALGLVAWPLVLLVTGGVLTPARPEPAPAPRGVPAVTPDEGTWNRTLAQSVQESGRVEAKDARALAADLAAMRDTLDRVVAVAALPAPAVNTSTPSFRFARDLARLLVARGVASAQDGRGMAAVEDWVATCRLGRTMGLGVNGTGTLIDVMIGTAIERAGLDALNRHARSGKMTPAEARFVLADLDRRPRETRDVAAALRGEAVYVRSLLEKLAATDAGESDLVPLRLLLPWSVSGRREAMLELARRLGAHFEAMAADAAAGRPLCQDPGDATLVARAGGWVALASAMVSREAGIEVAGRALTWMATPNCARAGERIEQREAAARQLRQLCESVR